MKKEKKQIYLLEDVSKTKLELTNSEFQRLFVYDAFNIEESFLKEIIKEHYPQIVYLSQLNLDAHYENVSISFSGYRRRTEKEIEDYDRALLIEKERQEKEKIKNEEREKKTLKKLIKKYGTKV